MAIRVMLVDDDTEEMTLVEGLLTEVATDFDVAHCATFEDGLAAMTEGHADIYLVDYKLGPRSGVELMTEAKEAGCTAPMLLVTGFGDYEVDVAAMDAGAAGYLVKGEFDGRMLERSIRYAITASAAGKKRQSRPGDLLLQVALARGATVREAARMAGVSERTAHRRNADPDFRAEVDELRDELRERLLAEVVNQMVGEETVVKE